MAGIQVHHICRYSLRSYARFVKYNLLKHCFFHLFSRFHCVVQVPVINTLFKGLVKHVVDVHFILLMWQTILCVPILNGVVELGSTDAVSL